MADDMSYAEQLARKRNPDNWDDEGGGDDSGGGGSSGGDDSGDDSSSTSSAPSELTGSAVDSGGSGDSGGGDGNDGGPATTGGTDISREEEQIFSGSGGGGDSGSDMAGGGGPEGGASARYGAIDTPSGVDDIDTDNDGGDTDVPDTTPSGPGLDPGASGDRSTDDSGSSGGSSDVPDTTPSGPGFDPGASGDRGDGGGGDSPPDLGGGGPEGGASDRYGSIDTPSGPNDGGDTEPDPTVESRPTDTEPQGNRLDVESLPPALREPISEATAKQRRQIAQRLEEETPVDDVDPSQIQVEVFRLDSGEFETNPELSDSLQREISERQTSQRLERSIFTEQAEEAFTPGGSPRTAADVPEAVPGEDFEIRRTESGFQVDVSPEYEKEIAAARIEGATPADFTTDDQGNIQPSDDYRREEAAEDIAGADPNDILLTESGVEVTDQFRREQAAAESDEFAPKDFVVDEDGQVRPSDKVMEQRAEQWAAEELGEPGFEVGDEIAIEDGEIRLTEQGEKFYIKDQVFEETGLDPSEDFVVQQKDGEWEVDLTDQGRIEMAGRTDAPPGDAVASTEGWLRRQATAHKVGKGWLPSSDQASGAVEDVWEAHPFASKSSPAAAITASAAGEVGKKANLANYGLMAFADYSPRNLVHRVNPQVEKKGQPDAQIDYAGAIQSAIENPYESAGRGAVLAGSAVVGGYATGRIAGRVARGASDRLRTLGGVEVDLGDITQQSVVRNLETEGAEGTDFPEAQDPGLYKQNPPEAVREQAAQMTPDEIDDFYNRAGVPEGSELKKAVDKEPEGPVTSRAGQGMEVPEGEYEAPGGFVGPELSPRFLRTESRPSFSWRPGVPDLGGRPTGVIVKTEVDAPEARTSQEFTEELLEREGETTALTKPASDVNVGEIEAVIPPGAEFAPVRSGRLSGALRNVGIGSEFYTELPSGRRVPLRPVADPDAISGTGRSTIRDLLSDERGQVGARASTSRRTYSLDELVSRGRRPVDRPLPTVPITSGYEGNSDPDEIVNRSDSELGSVTEYSESYADSDSAYSGYEYSYEEPGPSEPLDSLPGSPSEPSMPSEPSIPSDPGPPSIPGTPSVPSYPSDPSTPSEIGVPSLPSIPGEPSTPRLSDGPEGPEDQPTDPAFEEEEELFGTGIKSGQEILDELDL